MRRMLRRVTAGGLLTALVIGVALLSLSQRLTVEATAVSLRNASDVARIVRLTDGTTGRIIDTIRLDPWSHTVTPAYRPDIWWREMTAQERAAGLDGAIRLELLGEGCELLATGSYGGYDGTMFIDAGSAFFVGEADEEGHTIARRGGPSISVPDPCNGAPASAVGVVANATGVPVVVDGRIVVAACSISTVHAGDLLSAPAPGSTAGATPVTAPSVAVQKERWPIEPTSITVGRSSIDDSRGALLWPDVLSGCGGAPLDQYDLTYDEPYVPYVPPVPPAGG